jgi:hypothetical protein
MVSLVGPEIWRRRKALDWGIAARLHFQWWKDVGEQPIDGQLVRSSIVTTQSRYDTAMGTWYPRPAWSAGQVAFSTKRTLPTYGAVVVSVSHNKCHYWFIIWVSVLISPR